MPDEGSGNEGTATPPSLPQSQTDPPVPELQSASGMFQKKEEAPVKRTREKDDSGVNRYFTDLHDVVNNENPNTSYQFAGDMGKFLGSLEKENCSITLEGDQGSGKTKAAYVLLDEFLTNGIVDTAHFVSLEIDSRANVIRDNARSYITPSFLERVYISDSDMINESGLSKKNFIKQVAEQANMVVIDSWTHLQLYSSEIWDIIKASPETVFIFIFQRNTKGDIYGGRRPLFDCSVNMEVYRIGDDFSNTIMQTTKNRFGPAPMYMRLATRELVDPQDLEE